MSTNKIGFARHARAAASRGLTLIELMVALVIGLFLIVGLASLLVSNVRTRSELDRTAGQIENGRYTVSVLSEDLQHAGFLGATSRTSYTQVLPNPCVSALSDLGYTANTVGSGLTSQVPVAIYAPSSTPTCLSSAHVKTGPAVLVLTRVSTTATSTGALTSGETYLQISECATDASPFAIATSATGLPLLQKDCTTAAAARKVIQRIYFVATCNVCSGSNADTRPTLKMVEYANGVLDSTTTITPLVEGVEDLQFDYGVDTDNDGAPDCYVGNPGGDPTVDPLKSQIAGCNASYTWTNATTNWSNIVAVRIHVLARTADASPAWNDTRTYDMGLAYWNTANVVGPFNDSYKRHAMSVVARINNLSGPRQ